VAEPLAILLTDMVGSTRVARALGEDWPVLLARHFGVLSAAAHECNGVVASNTGDGLLMLFPTIGEAVRAAVVGQRRLAGEPWSQSASAEARMAIHRGVAVQTAIGYVGVGLHEAARLTALATGGQVLVSGPRPTAEELPDGVGIADLGFHAVRDFASPVELFAVVADGLRPIRRPSGGKDVTLDEPLIGRSKDISAVAGLIDESPLVTLVGPAGVGKTTLAMAVASQRVGEVVAVDLATVTASAMPGVLADAIGALAGLDALGAISGQIGERRLLLLLDNAEHVLDVLSGLVVRLRRDCPNLTILVTSREPLRVSGEALWTTSPLALEDAVALFVQRGRRVQRASADMSADAPSMKRVCEKLGGLPLAIELAAARTRSMSVADLEAHLHNQMRLLALSDRQHPSRYQTMRAAIESSVELLEAGERQLLGRLSMFADGAPLAGILQVASDRLDHEVIDDLDELVTKSLVEISALDGRPLRYRMLEPIRQFAAELLTPEERQASRAAAAQWIVELTRDGRVGQSTDTTMWRHVLDAERVNIAQAVSHLIDTSDVTGALRIVGSLGFYWFSRGSAQGIELTQAALSAMTGDEPAPTRARALLASAMLQQMEWPGIDTSLDHAHRAAALFAEVDSVDGEAWARYFAAKALAEKAQFDHDAFQRAASLFRVADDPLGEAWCLYWMADQCGDPTQRAELIDQILRLADDRRARHVLAPTLAHLIAPDLAARGHIAQAFTTFDEALELSIARGDHIQTLEIVAATARCAAEHDRGRLPAVVAELFSLLEDGSDEDARRGAVVLAADLASASGDLDAAGLLLRAAYQGWLNPFDAYSMIHQRLSEQLSTQSKRKPAIKLTTALEMAKRYL
jgi:predicted ATPase/class 3 adenylate cyclase/tetratricopeptide (TPR) repeat protein